MIERVAPAKPGELTHPATRTFQALRIAVNDELGELAGACSPPKRSLEPGGRLAVVTFHSLEDRIVKQFFARRSGRGEAASRLLPGEPAPRRADLRVVGAGQPVVAGERERAANPRARPAKLRFGERTGAPARASDAELMALTRLPARAAKERLMLRFLTSSPIVALVGSAIYAYSIKYQTIYASEQIVKTRHLIAKEQRRDQRVARRMRLLTRPERIQALADKHLELQPLALHQIVKAADLPVRAAARSMRSRRKIEALGLRRPDGDAERRA